MPVIPGGKGYRLPLISNIELAKFIVQVFRLEQPTIQTYTLVEDKQHDQNIAELLSIRVTIHAHQLKVFTTPSTKTLFFLNNL